MDESLKSSPASSPLSLHDSDIEAEYYRSETAETRMPPAKRQRVGDTSMHVVSNENDMDALSSISSDTSGDVPQSPGTYRPEDEDGHQEQVTMCSWEGCQEGDFGNMDRLVEHIHNDHIEGRQKKYTCEWVDCSRKSMPHASGYALKAHMRSHTREKPFYCALPECDRSFTRSDALAKHMRTVHETEALRPSDPIPKSMQPLLKGGAKLKLVIKPAQEIVNGDNPSPGHAPERSTYSDNPNSTQSAAEYPTPLTTDQGFTLEELALGPKELWRLLRRQLHWAQEEADGLRRECEMVEEIRKKEWLEKELLLDQVVKNELDWFARRKEVLAAEPPPIAEIRAHTLARIDALSGSEPVVPKQEDQREDQREAAAVLALLHQG